MLVDIAIHVYYYYPKISLTTLCGDPSLATWVQATIPTYPAGTNWNFMNSGTVDFDPSVWGQANVHFAFKYLSTTAASSTWEIKNLKVKGTAL